MEENLSASLVPVADESKPSGATDASTAGGNGFRRYRTPRYEEPEIDQLSIRRILIPTDFSPISLRAVDFAGALAHHRGAVLTVLHVIDVNSECEAGAAADLMGRLWEGAFEQMRHLAFSLGEKVNSQTVIEEGLPWEQIIEKSDRADLIILGKKDCKPVWSLFSKRTAQAVIEYARCPVMLMGVGRS